MANLFPKNTNIVLIKAALALGLVGVTVVVGVWYYATPKYSRIGYQPTQPVAFQHDIHVGQLGIDCRVCHSFVEVSGHSNIPTTQTCMSCHSQVQKDNPKLQIVRDSWDSGQPIAWVRIHHVPDYAYFNHSAHVNRGVSCVSCHGKVNEMSVVYQHESQSMAWCLSCHRHPEEFVRPLAASKPGETSPVFDMNWDPVQSLGLSQIDVGTKLVHDWKINPPKDCAGCHR